MHQNVKHLINDEQARYTIEASLLFPIILLMTMSLMLLSLFHYRLAIISIQAALVAERTAYVWGNSAKEISTGALMFNQYDGLYEDSFINDVKHMIVPESSISSNHTIANNIKPISNRELKLSKAFFYLPKGMNGEVSYARSFLTSKINARITQSVFVQNPFWRSGRIIYDTASSTITNPESVIRNVDLFVNYAVRIRSFLNENRKIESLGNLIPIGKNNDDNDAKSLDSNIIIKTETEAKEYIRKIVNGTGTNFNTIIGNHRQVDAIDSDGIAHEAKVTVNSSEADQQILKDVELMSGGLIKGVVWHFFRYHKTGKIELSNALRRKLEKNGIIIVIHN